MKKLTNDELVTVLRCCIDEDCARFQVSYQHGFACRDDVELQTADALENLMTEKSSLHQIIEKQGTMNKQLADKVLEMDAELAKVQAERDAAVALLREINWCAGCICFKGLKGCADNAMSVCCKDNDHYQFRGPQKEA